MAVRHVASARQDVSHVLPEIKAETFILQNQFDQQLRLQAGGYLA